MQYKWNTFPNQGYIVVEVPDDILAKFMAAYTSVKQDKAALKPFNDSLAGQLSEEYSLQHLIPEVQSFFNEAASEYMQFFNVPQAPADTAPDTDKKYDVRLCRLWLNIQKKGEYNPVHDHSGLLSFALWLKIPYSPNEEHTLKNTVGANIHTNGTFLFYFNDILGDLKTGHVNCFEEGAMMVFPSKLNHAVYPFYTSDEDRVSVSGNFYYVERG